MKRLLTIFVLALLLCGLVVVPAMAAAIPALAAKPPPDEIDKIVFVHYPQGGNVGYWFPSNAPAPTDQDTSYKYTGIHWAVPYVKYAVNPSGAPDGAGAAIVASFDTWQLAPGDITLTFERLSNTSETSLSDSVPDYNNVVSWESISTKYPGAIAVSFVWYLRGSKEIVDVDTIMNSAFPWFVYADVTTPDTPAYDVQNIMTHEAGHWLMLLDLYQWKTQKLTMYGYGALGELQKRTLGVGDMLGIDRIY